MQHFYKTVLWCLSMAVFFMRCDCHEDNMGTDKRVESTLDDAEKSKIVEAFEAVWEGKIKLLRKKMMEDVQRTLALLRQENEGRINVIIKEKGIKEHAQRDLNEMLHKLQEKIYPR